MKRLLLTAVVLGASAAGAQQPARPAIVAAPAFRFPRVQSHDLPNGLRVVVVEDHSLQVVAARAVVGVDETFDPPGKEGLYQVMINALREGTKTRTPAQLAEASARVGTPIAPTSFTTTPAGFEPSLTILGDMLMHPSFDQAGVDRRKAAQAAVFRTNASRVALVARNATYTLLNGRDDAIARGFYGSEAAVNSITRDDVAAFYDKYVGPKATTIVIVGDVSEAAALAAATKVFGGWRASATGTRPAEPMLPAPAATKVYLADIPSGTNAYITMAVTGPERSAPDAFAAEMLGTITTNRMLATLREKRAWSYTGNMVMSWHAARRGEFIGTTSVATTKADSALGEWLAVLKATRAAPPSSAELEAARRARVGALWSRIDGPDEIANRIAEAVRDGLPPNYLEQYAAGMNAVTPADVVAAAVKYADVDHLVIVVAGDRKVIEPALRAASLAPVVLIDANARPLP